MILPIQIKDQEYDIYNAISGTRFQIILFPFKKLILCQVYNLVNESTCSSYPLPVFRQRGLCQDYVKILGSTLKP